MSNGKILSLLNIYCPSGLNIYDVSVFSQVLVQFSGIVLVRVESPSDSTEPTGEETEAEETKETTETMEEQDKKSEEESKDMAEEVTAEETGELSSTLHLSLRFPLPQLARHSL